MTDRPDYAQIVRDRQAVLAAMPDRYHQIVGLHGRALVICRTTRIGIDGKFQYIYRLSYDCDEYERGEPTSHAAVIEEAAESDEKACRKFVHALQVVAHDLNTAADRNNLLEQAKWYDAHPNDRDE